jgi:hypothetical protein
VANGLLWGTYEGEMQRKLVPDEVPKSTVSSPLAVRRGLQRGVVGGGTNWWKGM